MTEFCKKVYEVVKKVPEGYVVTYSDIAIYIEDKTLSRAVGNALHVNPYAYTKENLELYSKEMLVPCHRVVNSKGELAKNFGMGSIDYQKELLEKENVKVQDYKVDLSKYRFKL